jgi:hypothetical protein
MTCEEFRAFYFELMAIYNHPNCPPELNVKIYQILRGVPDEEQLQLPKRIPRRKGLR